MGKNDAREHDVVFPRHQVRRAGDADHQHREGQRGCGWEYYYDCFWCALRLFQIAPLVLLWYPGIEGQGWFAVRLRLGNRNIHRPELILFSFYYLLVVLTFCYLIQWPDYAPEPDLSTVSRNFPFPHYRSSHLVNTNAESVIDSASKAAYVVRSFPNDTSILRLHSECPELQPLMVRYWHNVIHAWEGKE
jgi:hypothetical protein